MPHPSVATLLAWAALACCPIEAAFAKEPVASSEAVLRIGDHDLKLHGQGTRRRFGLPLYRGALYTTQQFEDGATLLRADDPVAMRLNVVSSLFTNERMRSMVDAAIRDEPDRIKGLFTKLFDAVVEPIRKGDEVLFLYVPGTGTSMCVNGKSLATVKDPAFRRALFAIWFGDRPVDRAFRRALLRPAPTTATDIGG